MCGGNRSFNVFSGPAGAKLGFSDMQELRAGLGQRWRDALCGSGCGLAPGTGRTRSLQG